MIFGNIDRFAIKVEIADDYFGQWLLGRICYVLNNEEVGDYGFSTYLSDAVVQSIYIKGYSKRRSGCYLYEMNELKAFSVIYDAIYRDDDSFFLDEPLRYSVAIPIDVFDDFKIFLVDCKGYSKIMYMNMANNRFGFSILNEFEFDGIFDEFYGFLSDLYDREILVAKSD